MTAGRPLVAVMLIAALGCTATRPRWLSTSAVPLPDAASGTARLASPATRADQDRPRPDLKDQVVAKPPVASPSSTTAEVQPRRAPDRVAPVAADEDAAEPVVVANLTDASSVPSALPVTDNDAVPPAPATDAATQSIELGDVVASIYRSYPLLEIAIYGRSVASGEQLAAEGAWDLKLKGSSDTGALGFYQTARNSLGVEQNLYGGGQVFGGYKIGRGNFEPWYGGRETNDGGEFRAGISVPLAQNRAIDEHRAELWKATYGRQAIEPAIQAQLIDFLRAGAYAYWDWVAAGLNYRYANELYELAVVRQEKIAIAVREGAQPRSAIVDNQRLIASRQVKLIDSRRKLDQTAVKLSLFYRTEDGQPFLPTPEQLPHEFPMALPLGLEQIEFDIAEALSRRPELVELSFQRRLAEIDLAQAHNLSQPEINATFWSAQDVGGAASSKKDKSPFQTEASVNLSVPLQRRKAQGKIWATEGKIAQLNAKREFATDKISVEVRNATIAVSAAYQSLEQARESVRLNQEMERFEAAALADGASDLLRLNLREIATFDARVTEVEALLRYFESQAELRAATAADIPSTVEMLPPDANLPVPR
jgi:outer membrane protein TolC